MAAATAALPERPAVPAPKPVDDKATRRQRTRLQQLEARLAQIDASNADLAAQLADPAIYSGDNSRATHLAQQQTALVAERETRSEEHTSELQSLMCN